MGRVLSGVKRKIIAGVIVLAAAMSINVVLAAPASADCTPNGIQFQIYKSADLMVGAARFNGCGNSNVSTTLVLQRDRWWGWQDLASTTAYGTGQWYGVWWNCAGAGTYTYRAIAIGRTVGGTPYTRISSELRTTC